MGTQSLGHGLQGQDNNLSQGLLVSTAAEVWTRRNEGGWVLLGSRERLGALSQDALMNRVYRYPRLSGGPGLWPTSDCTPPPLLRLTGLEAPFESNANAQTLRRTLSGFLFCFSSFTM